MTVSTQKERKEMQDKFLVLGMRVIQFTNDRLSGHNMNFTSEQFSDQKYEIICLDQETSQFHMMTCKTTHGMCGSGWCTASWGCIEATEVAEVGSLHYIPKESTTLDSIPSTDVENELFSFSESGGCHYYPSGWFNINLEGWRATGRKPSKPMIHVFWGDNASGKSTIASLTEKNIIESDSFETPDAFINSLNLTKPTENTIFVIGGKHEIDIDTVVELLKEHNTVVKVNFSLYSTGGSAPRK
jgi:hypothetical protein